MDPRTAGHPARGQAQYDPPSQTGVRTHTRIADAPCGRRLSTPATWHHIRAALRWDAYRLPADVDAAGSPVRIATASHIWGMDVALVSALLPPRRPGFQSSVEYDADHQNQQFCQVFRGHSKVRIERLYNQHGQPCDCRKELP